MIEPSSKKTRSSAQVNVAMNVLNFYNSTLAIGRREPDIYEERCRVAALKIVHEHLTEGWDDDEDG